MNILQIMSDRPDLGGVARYTVNLSNALCAMGHQVHVLGSGPRPCLHDGIRWIDVSRSAENPGLYSAIRDASRQMSFDIIHTHFRKASLYAKWIFAKTSAIHIYTLHLSHIPMGFPYNFLTSFGDCTHVPSKLGKKWLLEACGRPEGSVVTIPHGVDLRKFKPCTEEVQKSARVALGLPLTATIAAYVGRFETPKNEDWLIELSLLLPEVKFILMGDGPNRAALERNPGRATILDYADPKQIYDACDALLLPSTREGFSLVTAEGMACGRPTLRTRTAGTDETIVEFVTGMSCKIDRIAFFEAAKHFLRDRGFLKSMGQNAAKFASANLNEDVQFRKIEKLYLNLAGGSVYYPAGN